MDTTTRELWTVEEASHWLDTSEPLSLSVLSALGRDCSMVCRIWGESWKDKPVEWKAWSTERAYPLAVLKEVFAKNPATRDLMPD